MRPQIPVPGSRSLASRARSTETTAKHLLAGAASCSLIVEHTWHVASLDRCESRCVPAVPATRRRCGRPALLPRGPGAASASRRRLLASRSRRAARSLLTNPRGTGLVPLPATGAGTSVRAEEKDDALSTCPTCLFPPPPSSPSGYGLYLPTTISRRLCCEPVTVIGLAGRRPSGVGHAHAEGARRLGSSRLDAYLATSCPCPALTFPACPYPVAITSSSSLRTETHSASTAP